MLEWPGTVVRPRYSFDAQWIAFSSDREGTLDLYIVSTTDESVHRLTGPPFDETRPAWSPDGKALVYQTNQDGNAGLWTIRIESGETRRLTDPAHMYSTPDWSPRGDLITYVSQAAGSWDVWVIQPDGAGARQVTTHAGSEYQPKFSPDGARITFYPTWHGWTDIATVGVSGGDVTEVLRSEFEDYRPAWSPDGNWIAFASDRTESGGLWVVPAEGGEPVLVADPEVGADYPDWRPDGKALIYVEDSYESRLVVTSRRGGGRTPVGEHAANAVDRNPDWSPNGGTLAFETNRFGNEGNVVLRDMTRGTETRLSAGRVNDGTPRFAIDGERLVYVTSGGDQTHAQLMVHDLGSGVSERWTDLSNIAFPSFCGPEAIVFGWAEIAYVEQFELWRVEEGGSARRVGAHVIERGGLDCPSSGDWVVASLHQTRGGGDDLPRLARISLTTGEVQVLTRGAVPHLHPRLSPDGSEVLFVAESEGGVGAYIVSAEGGSSRSIVAATEHVAVADWAGPDSVVYTSVERIGRARMASTRDLR